MEGFCDYGDKLLDYIGEDLYRAPSLLFTSSLYGFLYNPVISICLGSDHYTQNFPPNTSDCFVLLDCV